MYSSLIYMQIIRELKEEVTKLRDLIQREGLDIEKMEGLYIRNIKNFMLYIKFTEFRFSFKVIRHSVVLRPKECSGIIVGVFIFYSSWCRWRQEKQWGEGRYC